MGREAAARLILMIVLAGATMAHAEILVPRSVSGELEYRYRTTDYETGYTTTSNMITGRITTDAYLWQPWFATLGLSLALSEEHSDDSNGSDSESQFATGEASLNLLPQSRFPFSARYTVSDSRVDSGDSDNPLYAQSTAHQFTRNNLQLTQGIHGQRYRLNLRYNEDEAQSDLGEHYYNEGYGVDYSLRMLKQNLSAKAYFNTQSNNQNDNESENSTFVVNHNYYPSSYTTLDSQASHVKSDNSYTSTGITQQVTNTIDQASTSIGWRSSTIPLRLHGSVRVHRMDYLIDDGTTSNTLQNEGLNSSIGASYQFSDRLTGSIGGQYGVQRNENEEVKTHSENATLGYNSERYTIREFDYGWNSSLSASNQESDESRVQSLNLALGHGASRSWRLERRSSLRLSLNQSVIESYNRSSGIAIGGLTLNDNTRRLSHSLNLGWSGSDHASSSLAQLSLTDSRGIIGDESRSQMANAQLSRTQKLDNRSSLNGNLRWQATHYIQQGMPDYGVGQSASASASYHYKRPFSLQRINFTSNLRLTENRPAEGAETSELYWDNRFTHEIGLMRSTLTLTMRDHLGQQSTMLLLTVKRRF